MTITEISAKYPQAWNSPTIVAQLEAANALRALSKEQAIESGADIAYKAARVALKAYSENLSEPYRYKLALKAADLAFKNWMYLN